MSGAGDYIATGDRSIDLQAVTVRVWEFADAPEEYRALAEHGGGKDWVVHVPERCVGRLGCVPYLESGEHAGIPLGRSLVSVYDLPGGGKVCIGGFK